MIRHLAWGLVSLGLLAGCAREDHSDLHQYAKQVKAREPGPIEPLPEIKQIETFVYEPGDRRSPFKLGSRSIEGTLSQPASGIKPDRIRRKEELEQFPLDSIRMVGTLEQEEAMWALVVDRESTLYRVQAGNYMGQNHGQITRIAEERIELTEIVPDGMNGWQERQATVALSE